MNKRNYLIDLLRFIAAVWVAIYHFNESVSYINNWYRSFLKLGYLGVPIFFVISGYCIYLAAENSKTAKDFIIRRFFRIFPAYWFSILIVLFVVVVSLTTIKTNSVAVLPKTIPGMLATVSLLTVPFSGTQVINWVYWTLTYEIFFYLVMWIFLLFPARHNIYWLLLISILTLVLPEYSRGPLFFLKQWPVFCLGLVVYRVLHHSKQELWQNILLFAFSLYSLFTIHYPRYYPYIVIIIIILLVANHLKPLANNFMSKLGDYSYAIYLIHVPIGVYLLGAVKQTELVQTNIWINIIWDLTLLNIIIILSRFMYMYIEMPAIKAGKRVSDKYKKSINAN